MNFVNVELKLNGMRKSQNFVLYPCLETDTTISIQSDNRFCLIDLDTGRIVQSQPKNYATSISLMDHFKPLRYVLDTETFEKIKEAKKKMIGITRPDRTVLLA
jgi:hypothetical protein